MKKLLIYLFGFLCSLSLQAQFSKASVLASGLTCSLCSKAVKSALEQVPFVQTVDVDIKSQEYQLTFKSGMQPDFDALKVAVEDAGFSVASLKITGDFSNVKVEKDRHIRIGTDNFHFLKGFGKELNGEQTLTIVDKDFLPSKEYKRHSSMSKMECIRSGTAASCCEKDGIQPGARIYHVII